MIILFLLHLRSALLPILSLPVAVAVSFIPMWLLGIPATIMSLGGIAIAIGAMVDAAVVMIENMHKHLERRESGIGNRESRGNDLIYGFRFPAVGVGIGVTAGAADAFSIAARSFSTASRERANASGRRETTAANSPRNG